MDEEFEIIIRDITTTVLEHLPRIIFFFIIMFIAHRLLETMLKRLELYGLEEIKKRSKSPETVEKRANTLLTISNKFILTLFWILAIMVFLGYIGVNISPFLAVFSVFGFALGFGAQDLVRDSIAGIFILVENQIRVGDGAIINGTSGIVEAINFRTVVLRDLSGVLHIFPNGKIDTLANRTKDWSAYVFEIGVAYKENIDNVLDIMREVGDTLKNDDEFGHFILDNIEIYGLDQFGDSALVIKGRIKTYPGKQFFVGREYNKRIKEVFDDKGIEIPFPHMSLYFGSESEPIDLKVEETQ